MEAARGSARPGRRGLGASEERSAPCARAPDGPPNSLSFIRRNRVLIASAACLALGAVLVVQSGRTTTRGDVLGRFFLELMAPLQRSTSAVGRLVSGSWQDV